ncbi:MAG TPA: hypothetical protein VK176_00590 [Phycisphaerales bacterium]|nr:hypothetical protein [Phycisphaerales bacterium]
MTTPQVPPQRPRQHFRRGSTRTVGLVVSIITAMLFIALVGYFYLRGRGGTAPVVVQPQREGDKPPDIKAAVPGQSLGAGKGVEIVFFDQEEPTRVKMKIMTESSEPEPGGRYIVTKPSALIYSKDGRVTHIRADSGTLYIPASDKMSLQQATLRGNVLARIFEASGTSASFNPDSSDNQELARFVTDSTVQYDSTIGEVTTEGSFKVTSDSSEYSAVGLRVVFNQDKDRLEYLEAQRDQHLRYDTRTKDRLSSRTTRTPQPASAPTPTPAAPPQGQSRVSSPAPAAPLLETFYVATLSGGVVVTRGVQTIESDALDGWLRIVDNKLADNAIARGPRGLIEKNEPPSSPASPPAAENEDASPQAPSTGLAALLDEKTSPPQGDGSPSPENPATDAGRKPSAESTLADDGIIDIRWPGQLVIRTAERRPQELSKDEVTLRFTTGPDSLSRFRDSQQRATATASTIEYGATSQELRLRSLTPGGVVLTSEGQGRALASSMDIDLFRGLTTVQGPGTLESGERRAISWSERAEFQFATRAGGGMTSVVESARADGDVLAVQDTARLEGQALSAAFTNADGKTSIYKLSFSGEASARDGQGAELFAESVDVTFANAPDGKNPTPEVLDARGDVTARSMKDGSTLSSQTLRVTLTTDADGKPRPVDVQATDRASFTRAEERKDGSIQVITARSDDLRVDVATNMVELTGPESSIAYNQESMLVGEMIRIDGVREYVDVFGKGRFEHRGRTADSDAISEALVTWTRSTSYDHKAGVVECEGNVVATNRPDTFSLQTLRADRAKLILEPPPPEAGASDSATTVAAVPAEGSADPAVDTAADPASAAAPATRTAGLDGQLPQARILQAMAWGIKGENPRPAQLEIREYSSAFAVGRERPTRVGFLEGDYIFRDESAGTLNVPGPGRLFMSDRSRKREPAAAAAQEPSPRIDTKKGGNPFGDFDRGDARFVWQDGMDVDMRLGTVTLRGKANMRHVRLSDGLPTDIESDSIIGRFRNMRVSQSERTGKEFQAEFLGADAVGNVWIRSTDNKELIADRVEYDAESGVAKAIASEGNTVVFFDPTQGVPQRARVLFWDQTNNRIEIRDAGTVVLPR